jgi:uncharacterized protein YcfJ
MHKTKLALAVATLLAGLATSASAQVYGDVARVISATPITERVAVPKRECLVEPSGYDRAPPAPTIRSDSGAAPTGAGAVLGAIIGGVIGHQFGNSTGGHDHGTAAGAVIGGLIGNSIEKDQSGYQRAANEAPAPRPIPPGCETVTEMSDRIVGYDVRYEYNGREFRTRMPYDPGPQMAVNVEVRPPMPREPAALGPRTPNYRGTY